VIAVPAAAIKQNDAVTLVQPQDPVQVMRLFLGKTYLLLWFQRFGGIDPV